MSSPERQLRLVQCSLIVFIVVCFFVKRIGRLETHDALSPVQWLIIVAAIWSAISGFTVQRRINRIGSRSQTQPRRSTPVSRWRTGHLVRLWTATAMGGLMGASFALHRRSRVACQCLPWTRSAASVDMEAGSYSRPSTTPLLPSVHQSVAVAKSPFHSSWRCAGHLSVIA